MSQNIIDPWQDTCFYATKLFGLLWQSFFILVGYFTDSRGSWKARFNEVLFIYLVIYKHLNLRMGRKMWEYEECGEWNIPRNVLKRSGECSWRLQEMCLNILVTKNSGEPWNIKGTFSNIPGNDHNYFSKIRQTHR